MQEALDDYRRVVVGPYCNGHKKVSILNTALSTRLMAAYSGAGLSVILFS